MATINLSEAKDRLSKLVKDTAETTEPVSIAVHGRKQVVLISQEEYDSMKETIEVLKDQALVKKIIEASADIKAGRLVDFDRIRKDI